MGNVDARSREYVRQPEVFADICNYMLYQGRQVILPEQLQEKDATELIIPFNESENGSIPIQKFRDVMKQVILKESDHERYMIIGIENQSEIHYAMTVRNLLYDAIDYASQVHEITKKNRKEKNLKSSVEFLSGMRKDDKLIPVITIVIYWGSKQWDGARTLQEMVDCKEELLQFIPDYHLNLIAPNEINDFEKFHSDMGLIMHCLKCTEDEVAFRELLVQEQERLSNLEKNTAAFIAELTNVKEIELQEKQGGRVNMCKAIEDMLADSEKSGKVIEKVELIRNNLGESSIEAIARFMKVDETYVTKVVDMINAHPEEDDSEIAKRLLG